MSKNSSSSSSGIGFFGAFFLVLLVLKLTETISWSWWWITAPLWGSSGILLTILLSVAAHYLIWNLLKKGFQANRHEARERKRLKKAERDLGIIDIQEKSKAKQK